MKKLNSQAFFFTALFLTLISASGCLKTRAELKHETDDSQTSGGQNNANQNAPAPVAANAQEMDELKTEITHLTGRIEELERSQKPAPGPSDKANAPEEKIKQLEKRITELEQAQATLIESVKKGEAETQVAATGDLFEKGKKEFESSDYQGAINSFNALLKNPKAKHVQDATFMRGECYFALQDYKKAIIDYSKFPEKFTESKKMPAALYKIGLSFEALGMKDDAKGFYQELVEKFPKSAEARKARPKIK